MKTYTISANRDPGSLAAGKVGVELKVGDQIQLQGEAKPRTVTFIMGKGEKLHACCKGFGPFPAGEITFSVVGAEEAA